LAIWFPFFSSPSVFSGADGSYFGSYTTTQRINLRLFSEHLVGSFPLPLFVPIPAMRVVASPLIIAWFSSLWRAYDPPIPRLCELTFSECFPGTRPGLMPIVIFFLPPLILVLLFKCVVPPDSLTPTSLFYAIS